jgi:hypothetical protein
VFNPVGAYFAAHQLRLAVSTKFKDHKAIGKLRVNETYHKNSVSAAFNCAPNISNKLNFGEFKQKYENITLNDLKTLKLEEFKS